MVIESLFEISGGRFLKGFQEGLLECEWQGSSIRPIMLLVRWIAFVL